ncbi:MAG: ribonuclease Y [Armatimonadetes bacterium]|nr:ribonuclease Y [Armatimonadota bacterium]
MDPYIVVGVALALAGLVLGYSGLRLRRAGEQTLRLERAALETQRAELRLQTREEAERLRQQLQDELRERREAQQQSEGRLAKKEETLERQGQELQRRERELVLRDQELEQRRQVVERAEAEQSRTLERLSGLTMQEARQVLLQRVEEEARQESAHLARSIEEEARREAERRARAILALAMERCSVEQVTESSVAVVPLASDEIKGRIIGREGRNIRSFEQLTGVDLVIDDTPEAVVISAFDPIRREIARMALEVLVADGRIHPGRIEEVVERCRRELDESIAEAGAEAGLEAGVPGLPPALQEILGRLRYRTSYGQNVLRHSVEVARLAATMAAELGANVEVARRAGLLHDIGKGMESNGDAPHAVLGMDFARQCGEAPAVCHAIGAHHRDVEPETAEAALVLTADALSAARPGARRDTLESYIQRVERLENLAASFPGVAKAYAIQAGREVRIVVRPDEVDDLTAQQLAREIAERIQGELAYPGQIKVTVIREQRAVEYAK